MRTYYAIVPHDTPTSVPVFRYVNQDGIVVLRERYHNLACAECDKIDEMRALELGISEDIAFVVKRDIFISFEGLYIVSRRIMELLERVANGLVAFYGFPGAPEYYVAMARHVIIPTESDPVYRRVGKCTQCGRYKNIVFNHGVPRLTGEPALGAIYLEGGMGITPVIVAEERIVQAIKDLQPKVRATVYIPIEQLGHPATP